MIGIQGIRVVDVDISKESNGQEKVTGHYELVSTNDRVLAKQGFNGYSDIKVEPSAETRMALITFLEGLKRDVISVLGLQETQ